MAEFIQPSLEKRFEEKYFRNENPLSKILNLEVVENLTKSSGTSTSFTPIIIEAPFGSGKTQILLELFKYFWKNGVPALFVNMSELYRDLKNEGGTTIIDSILGVINKKLDLIIDNLDKENVDLSQLYLPKYVNATKVLDLFKIISLDESKVKEYVNEYKNNKKPVILLIDEIENEYTEFVHFLEEKEGKSIRDFIDDISNNRKVFIIMAFGRKSYYDVFLASLKDYSVQRRVYVISIPTFSPDSFKTIYSNLNGISSNSLWWLTRGRIGWTEYIIKQLPSLDDTSILDDNTYISHILQLDQKPLFRSKLGSNIPIINFSALHEDNYCDGNLACKASIRYLMLKLEPLKFDTLPEFVRNSIRQKLGDLISGCRELIDVNEFLEKFISDISESLGDKIKKQVIADLKTEMETILSAFSDNNNKICLGAYGIDKLSNYVYGENGLFNSLIDLTKGYIIDQYGVKYEKSEGVKIDEILYALEIIKSKREEFKKNSGLKFYELLRQKSIVSPSNQTEVYVELSPWVIELLFPFPISNPIVTSDVKDHDDLINKLKEYYNTSKEENIASDVENFNKILFENQVIENNYFYVLPIYDDIDITKICELIHYIIEEKIENIKSKPSIIHFIISSKKVINNKQINDELNQNCISKDSFLRFLHYFSYLRIHPLDDELINDFIRSYFLKIIKDGGIGNDDESIKQKIDYYKLIISELTQSLVDKKPIRGTSNLQVDDDCKKAIINVINRVKSGSARTNLSTLFPLIYRDPCTKDILTELAYMFGKNAHRIIDAETLPTVYREGVEPSNCNDHDIQTNKTCNSLKNFINNEDVRMLVLSSIDEINKNQFNDVLGDEVLDIIYNRPPLFNYFKELYNIKIVLDEGKKIDDFLRYVYSGIIYYMYIIYNADKIKKYIKENLSSFVSNTESVLRNIEDLYDSIKKNAEQLKDTYITINNFDIIYPGENHHNLKRELDLLKKLVDYIDNKLKDTNISQEDYLNLVFLASVGSEKEKLSLNSLYDNLVELQNNLDELNSKISELKDVVTELKSDYNTKYNIDLIIEYTMMQKGNNNNILKITKDIDNLKKEVEELVNEIIRNDIYRNNIKKEVINIKREWDELQND